MFVNETPALTRIHFAELGFAVRPTEPGGAVEDGITMQTLREWDAAHGLPEPTLDDLKNLPLSEEQTIYLKTIFKPVRFDELQSGVDYVLADDATNSGVSGALTRARKVCGTICEAQPWHMEDVLLAKLNAADPLAIIDALCDARWQFMQDCQDFWQKSHVDPSKFIGDGRAKRMNVVYGGALQFAGIPLPPSARYIVPPKPAVTP